MCAQASKEAHHLDALMADFAFAAAISGEVLRRFVTLCSGTCTGSASCIFWTCSTGQNMSCQPGANSVYPLHQPNGRKLTAIPLHSARNASSQIDCYRGAPQTTAAATRCVIRVMQKQTSPPICKVSCKAGWHLANLSSKICIIDYTCQQLTPHSNKVMLCRCNNAQHRLPLHTPYLAIHL